MPIVDKSLSVAGLMPVWFRLVCCAGLLTGAWAGAQGLEEARKQFLQGKYEGVLETARNNLERQAWDDEWRMLLVEASMALGRYPEAYTNAQEGVRGYSRNIPMRLIARETAFYQNDLEGASRRLAEIKVLVERRRLPADQSPEELVALGQALLLLGVEPKLVLQNCFQPATKVLRPPRQAFLSSGQLALDKHDLALAADLFRAGIKKFPEDPDLYAGLAAAFEPSDRREMQGAIEAALKLNPRHARSRILLADHLIDAEQYDEAQKQLELVLEVNPHHPEALAYRSVLARLRNDVDREAHFRQHALRYWQANPQVDHLIGLKLSQKYRFSEGAAAQRLALAFDPEYLPARRQLAQDLLRLGQTEEGWQLVEAVHAQDDYDVTAYNLATLRDQMARFQTLSNEHFILRMSPLEAQVYGDRVLDLLARAKATLGGKYGIELSTPTTVEIFPQQKDFAVRTFGMPGNPGYLGVCFGSVITANSPASQAPNPANWQDVLWHEFCHVITLTATRNRMPRWLSEGISVYEERQANPAWGETMNLAHRQRIVEGGLTPLGELSGAFLSPQDSSALQFAYYESSLAVEFVVEKFGLEPLKRILRDLGEGVEINRALADRTLPLPELEKQFAAFARQKALNLAPGVDLTLPPKGASKADRALWEKLHPDSYSVRLERAQALMRDERWADAKPVLESLANGYVGERGVENPLWLLAVTQRHLGDTNAELAVLRQLAEREAAFASLDTRLVELTLDRKDWPAVTQYANRLLAINPLVSLPYRGLAEAGMALGRNEQAADAFRRLLLLDPPDPAEIHYHLGRLLHARGDAQAEAKRHVLRALEEAPRFRDAQSLLLELQKGSAAASPSSGQESGS